MPFTNIKIVGGEFNDIQGNYRLIDHSRHETNIDSNNMYNNKLTNSYNNSKKFSGQNLRSRSAYDDEEGWTPSTQPDHRRRRNYTEPLPSQSRFMPRQTFAEGGQITNRDSFNMKNNQICDSFNDYSETHYVGRAPPICQQRRGKPQNLQSNNELFESGRIKASEQISNLPQYLENSVRPHIQHINQNMRQAFSKMLGQTQSLSEKYVVPNMPGNDEDDESDSDSSSSHSSRAKDTMSTMTDDLSIHDPIPSPTLKNNSRPQVVTSSSRNPTFFKTKSNTQKSTTQVDRQMNSYNSGLCNNSYSHHSNPNSSFPPHITEPAIVDCLALSTSAQRDEIYAKLDSPDKPLHVSTSTNGPIFRTINGDFTRYDTSLHQTNISSFNTKHNTIQNSFNDSSLVDSPGK